MVDAAVGSRGILGRLIEKSPGIPSGDYRFLNFDTASLSRHSKENESTAITGFGGVDRGTPGQIDHDNKLKYDLTAFRFLVDIVGEFGAPASITDLGAGPGPWLVKIRPGSASPTPRGVGIYFHEGGSYSAVKQHGRRVSDTSLVDTANKRVAVDVTYTEPTGDTIAGNPVAAVGNTGTLDLKQVGSRGRRKRDADFLAGKSVYVKVTAITGPGQATLAAVVDVPGFAGVVAYGANTFAIFVPDDLGHDGYATVRDSNTNLLLGNFKENHEPFEITLGDQDLTTLAVGDEFEFPVSLAAPTKVVVAENRLSSFHLLRLLDGSREIKIHSGTIKLSRPYKPDYSSGRKLPSFIDPMGDIEATVSFNKRLVDRYFRDIQDEAARFFQEDVYKFGNPIDPLVPDRFEGIHIFYPQTRVSTDKAGDIPNKNTLEETVTLAAEQPDATPAVPTPILDPLADFDADARFPYQINVVTPIDPSFLA